MEFRDIERRPVVHQVAEQLREAVVEAVKRSVLLPGETSLSRALTVSRPTLREALRILEAEGLVTRDARTSALRPDARAPAMSRSLRAALTVLTRTERITLAEIVDLRATIEERAARRAAEVATKADFRQLETAMNNERLAVESGSDADSASFRFHLAVVSASHNEAFVLVMLAAREAAADLLELAAAHAQKRGQIVDPEKFPVQLYDPAQLSLQRHREVYQALKEHRGADAAALVRTGLEGFYSPLMAPLDGDSGDQS